LRSAFFIAITRFTKFFFAVQCEAGKGARFILTLPRRHAAAAAGALAAGRGRVTEAS